MSTDTRELFGDLDLDAAAAKREVAFPDGIPVTHKGEKYTLPAELPAEALDPLMDLDIDMASIVASAMRMQQTASDEEQRKAGTTVVIEALLANPNLPMDLMRAVKECMAVLFGDQWPKFVESRPSIPTYAVLLRGLWRAYGVSLGEAFGSRERSESDGETSSPTSSASTKSTPARSGSARAKKASLVSAAS